DARSRTEGRRRILETQEGGAQGRLEALEALRVVQGAEEGQGSEGDAQGSAQSRSDAQGSEHRRRQLVLRRQVVREPGEDRRVQEERGEASGPRGEAGARSR